MADRAMLSSSGTRQEDEFVDSEPDVELDEDFSNVVIVDNIPCVGPEKVDKLWRILHDKFAAICDVPRERTMMPIDPETKMTKGFLFLELPDEELADRFRHKFSDLRLDKKHRLKVNTLADLERVEHLPAEYEPYEAPVFQERGNLREWLLDPRGRDQFLVRHRETTSIHWNEDGGRRPPQVYTHDRWTLHDVLFSPLGTYIATFHRAGVALWNGVGERIMRLAHERVQCAHFSPREHFVATWSNYPAQNPTDKGKIIVWDVRSGRQLRSFEGIAVLDERMRPVHWPVLQWSHDDAFVSRADLAPPPPPPSDEDNPRSGLSAAAVAAAEAAAEDTGLNIYETSTMALLHKRRVRVPHLRGCAWSPTQNAVAYWVPEIGSTPARVAVLRVPDLVELRKKTLFTVGDISLVWHPQGKFLCVKAEPAPTGAAAKKGTNFEFFRMAERDIPVEVLRTGLSVIDCAFEPTGDRFAVLHGTDAQRPELSVYSLAERSVKKIGTVEKRNVDRVVWSPQGRFLLLAGLGKLQGALEFLDMDQHKKNIAKCSVGTGEHFMATNAVWDPSGRFVATFVTAYRYQMENGYAVWDFRGKRLHGASLEQLWQFQWRPRPPTLLSAEQRAEVEATLRERLGRYEQEDRLMQDALSEEEMERRAGLRREFAVWQDRWTEQYAGYVAGMRDLGVVLDGDDDDVEDVEQVDERVVSEHEELVV